MDARRTLRAHEVPLHNRVRENPQPALVRVKAVPLVESRGSESRHVRPPDAGARNVIGDPNLAQGDVSLAFFIVPVATVGSVALAVAFFYAWRCWRDRKRRPVRPSALNIVGIEA